MLICAATAVSAVMNTTAPIRSATRKLAFVRVVMVSTKVEYIVFIVTQGRGTTDQGLGPWPFDQFPEARLVQQRNPVAALAETLDFHQLQSGILARGLQRVGPAADDDGRLRRWSAVDDRTGSPRGVNRFLARAGENSGERDVHAFERAQCSGAQQCRPIGERLDQLIRAFV